MSLATQQVKPRIILGLMNFGPNTKAGARITDLEEYKTFLDHFQAAGYNEVDTARTYINGEQEAFTKQAGWKDRGLKIATKVYPVAGPAHGKDRIAGEHRPEVLRERFEKSLKELDTDCVDIFYLHAADRSTPFAETLEAVNAFHKEGKFVQFGLSNFTAFEVAEIVMICKYNNWVRPGIYQGMYNPITRSLDKELIPALRRYGIDLVVYNPIAGGLFSGKYKTKDIPAEGRYSNAIGPMGDMYRARYFKDSTFKALQIIEPAVEKAGLTMIETAFRWCIHHSGLNVLNGNDGIIIGVSTLAQLDGNLKDCEKGPLPEEVVKALDEAWAVCRGDTANYWHLDLKYSYDTRKALFGL